MCSAAVMGSIPAWAGEPHCAYKWTVSVRVYPRVGGGTFTRLISAHVSHGLSPRGRGNLCGLSPTLIC